MQFDQARLEVQRQGGAIADRLFKAIMAHIAARIFLRPKGIERVAVAPVDRRPGQPEQESVRQRFAHLDSQVAFLGAVRFIHQHHDILAVVEHAIDLAKFKDGGDDNLARILAQQPLQFLARFGLDQIGDIGGMEGSADLGIQVDAVDHDQHGGVAQRGLHAQLLGGEHHQQRLAAALKMPDQALFGSALQHAPHDGIGGFVLLVAAHDLHPALAFVGGEQGKVGQDIQDHFRAQQEGMAFSIKRKPFLQLSAALPRR
jgi:hypothetical protein